MLYCEDGRAYVDTVAGLCAVSIGYGAPMINDAIIHQLGYGVSFSLPTVFEEEVALHLLRFLGWGERVRFSKNGADVTNLAVKLARQATARDDIVAFDYHGHDDWFQAGQSRGGIPPLFANHVLDRLPLITGNTAALILEPVPSDGKQRAVEDLRHYAAWANDHGALLIYDCIVTGMRLNRRGWPDDAPEPDLACYGKAMGNGMPLSALVGPADIMDLVIDHVFFSTTFGGECASLAAADAVLTAYETRDVLNKLQMTGALLNAGLAVRAANHGLGGQLNIVSYLARPFHKWRTPDQARRFTEVMLEEGILYQGYHNLMLATCEPDPIARIEAAYDVACAAVAAL